MTKPLLVAFALLLAGPVQAEGLFGETAEPGQMPSRFLQIEALTDCTILTSAPDLLVTSNSVVRVTYQSGRFRAGIGLCELWTDAVFGDVWDLGAFLPVHVGYVLWSNPKRTWFCYGHVPEVYAQVTGSILSNKSFEQGSSFARYPTIRAALCCDVDYYGVGARLEAGWLWLKPSNYTDGTTVTGVYAGVTVRLLTFGIGF